MSDIFVISDTHFAHENIIKYGQRPFDTVKEMNEKIVDNWNKTVKNSDIIYHLGDVYMGVDGVIPLSRLRGKKRLILGNHDDAKDPSIQKYFQKITVWRAFRDFGLLLTHVPVHPKSLEMTKGDLVNVHGHIHQNKAYDDRYINVCVEWINYTPVNIEELKRSDYTGGDQKRNLGGVDKEVDI